MLMLKIAFRNILRQKRRSILTGLSMMGGFVLAAFSIGWADGSYKEVINTFTRNQMGHIQVHYNDYLDRPTINKTLNRLPEIYSILKETNMIDSWAPRLYSAGLAAVGEKTAGVRIIGIDVEREIQTTHFNQKIVKGKVFNPDVPNETILGKGVAKLLKADINDDIVIISQGADGSIANDKYKIIGIVETGDETGDRTAFYLPLSTAQELLALQGRVHEIAITTQNLNQVSNTTQILKQKLSRLDPKLNIEPWQVFAKDFYIAMKADEEGQWIMLLIIVLVVGVGVLNTVLMSVLERRKEYGVLKALGTKPKQIINMILLEVSILALICIILGSAVGLACNYYVSLHGYTLSEPLTYGGMSFSTMRAEVNARSFYIPGITILLTGLLVGIFPALKAAHTDPARSMRSH